MTRIAALQMCSSDNLDDNLATAATLIAKAVSRGTKLIVLPEMFPLMGRLATDKVMIKETESQGKIQDFLAEQAQHHAVWIVGGTIPLACENPNKVRASCLIYDQTGKQVARYDKMHLFDAVISSSETYRESDTTEAGQHPMVIETPVGRLGVAVCYDIRFPELFARLSQLEAEIIAIPAAFTVKTGKAHWKLLARSRAVDSFCYVIGACQGGQHASGRQTYGHSLIVDPWGTVIQEVLSPGSAVIDVNVDLNLLYSIRKSVPINNKKIANICKSFLGSVKIGVVSVKILYFHRLLCYFSG